MSEVVRLVPCPKCEHALEEGASFCSACGYKIGNTPEGASVRTAVSDFAKGTAQEVRNLSIEAMRSDTGKKVAAGAALGATIGAAVPLVGPLLGATFGAGYVAFKRLTR